VNVSPQSSQQDPQSKPKSTLAKWLPLIIILGAMALVYFMGWHKYLTFELIGRNYDVIRSYISSNLMLSILAYMGLYIIVVALSLPGALALTLAGGLLFGWQIGAPITIIAATIGATVIFLVAKTSLGDTLAAKAGPAINALREGFQKDAMSYLLFLRLVPAFPFFVVNLAPALLGVNLRTYVTATFLGIIPGSTAFSFAASQLGSVVERTNTEHAACVAQKGAENCPYTIDTSTLVSKEIILAFAAIGVVALIPVIVKRIRGGNS